MKRTSTTKMAHLSTDSPTTRKASNGLILLALTVGVLLLVGCGGSSDSNSTSTQTGGAPSGIVVSVDTTNQRFVLQETNGTQITVDTVSGTTYQSTVALTSLKPSVGVYIAGLGTVSGGTLVAAQIAIVPTPPSYIPSSEVTTTSQGTIYFGQITAVGNGTVTITTGEGSKTIQTSSASTMTMTTSTNFSAIAVGDQVEVNGPEVNSTLYDGHQINIGLTPAVVGQFD